MEYRKLETGTEWTLLNDGGLVLVCTKSPSGRYDAAPVAWNCPLDYEGGSKILFVCDPAHESFRNIEKTGEFALALPVMSQEKLVMDLGSCSGAAVDKYAKFGIQPIKAESVDALVPEGVAAWLECRLSKVIREGSVAIVIASVTAAKAVTDAWKLKLHYVREGLCYAPGKD